MKYVFILLTLILVTSCSESEAIWTKFTDQESDKQKEWSNSTLEHYNANFLRNSPGCPGIPGTYFSKYNSKCVTYFPAMGKYINVKENPSYRYSVPLRSDEDGKYLFEADPEVDNRCIDHPKIEYIKNLYHSKYTFEVIAGKAEIDIENSAEISTDGGVCKLSLSEV